MLRDAEHVSGVLGLDHDDLRLRADSLASEHRDRLTVATTGLRARDTALQEPQHSEYCGEREHDPQAEQEVVQGQASTFSRMRVMRTA
ncbi:hypothetical protein MOX01_30060 [Microbacterium oxydans]|nr:hypothetical protein MOX01_30060 [Microbacterium oxydans]